MTTNEKIVAMARHLASDGVENDEAFWREYQELSGADMALVQIATKLMEGKPYRLHSDNAETRDRASSLAEHMGATVTVIDNSGWLGVLPPEALLTGITSLRFDPPTRQ
jgi:hypothetical protein